MNIQDHIKSIIDNSDYDRKEKIAKLTTLFIDEKNEKQKLISEVINEGSDMMEQTRDSHYSMIEDYQKSGFDKDIHPNNIESIKTGLHYTHGYSIGHLSLLERVNKLMAMSIDEIKELIVENERISSENRKTFGGILNRIKQKNQNG